MTMTTPTITRAAARRPALQRAAAAVAGLIALLYVLMFVGALEIQGASSEELGILGVAAGMFVVIAGLLWFWRSRGLWIAVAGIQVLLGWMYVAIAPDRDPSFEVWGVSIRVVSLVLVAALVALLVTDRATDRTNRTGRGTGRSTLDLDAADLHVIDLYPADRVRR